MKRKMIRATQIGLAVAALAVGLFGNDVSPTKPGSLVSQAHAIIGRPLTPMSYAGVARRSAVGVGVGVGVVVGVGAAAVVAAPVCSQVVDVYGRITTVCR
jgi:hypothetical protein